jgi:hypothetical protein
MVDQQYLLSSKQMASFVADGYLRFDNLVPDEINQAAMRELEAGVRGAPYGTPLRDVYPADSAIGRLLALPEVQGIVESLVGPEPLFDHHAIHVRQANEAAAQHLHADAVIDTRQHFDIQLMYYPHAIPLEMGGTLLVPGTHFRKVNESEIGRYQNMRGQIPMVCEAGTLLVLHHGIWHCGRQNTTGRVRYMFKIRLNPTVRQLRLWNTDDLADPEVERILAKRHPWFEDASGRLEIMNRSRLWRFLTGDARYDTDYWLTRVENMPETLLEEAPAR